MYHFQTHFSMNNNSLYHSGFTLLIYEEKSENWQLGSEDQSPLPLPSSFPCLWQPNRNQNLNSGGPGPKASWGDRGEPPPVLQLRLGAHVRQRGSLISAQQGRLVHRGAGCCPVQWSRAMGFPTDRHAVPSGAEPKHPLRFPAWPPRSQPCFSLLLSCCITCSCGRSRTTPPPPCLGSPPVWPSACSRADFSSQNHSPGPGWAGKQDFLTLFCLMLEERPARQNWWNLKIAQHQLSLSASLSYKLVQPKRNPKSEPGCLKRAITTKPSFSLPAVCWMLFRVYDRITIRRRSPRSVVGDACRGPRGWCEAALPSSLCLPLQGLSWAPGDPT